VSSWSVGAAADGEVVAARDSTDASVLVISASAIGAKSPAGTLLAARSEIRSRRPPPRPGLSTLVLPSGSEAWISTGSSRPIVAAVIDEGDVAISD